MFNELRLNFVLKLIRTLGKFLLSEHVLCKESIVIVKKLDFEVLTYLYVLRSPEFIYAFCGDVCTNACM